MDSVKRGGIEYVALDNADEETEGNHVSYPKGSPELRRGAESRPVFAFPVKIQDRGYDKASGKRWILPKYEFLSPGEKAISFAERTLKQYAPDIWHMLYPRVIQGAEKYHSAREAAAMLSLSLWYPRSMGLEYAPTTYKLMVPSMKPLIDQRMPLKYIAPDLIKAIRDYNTFKQSIDWAALDLPAEQGVFLLPRGTLLHPIDGDVAFLFYARQKAGVYELPFPDANGARTAVVEDDRFVFTVGCPYSPNLVWYDSNITSKNRPLVEFGNLFWNKDGTYLARQDEWPLEEGDAPFIEECGKLLFGTLIALEAEPSLRESSSRQLRVVRGKKGKSDLDIWSPHIVGEKFQYLPVIGPHGTHATPRWHWRSSYHRMQPCGPGNLERKRIRIQGHEVSKARRPLLHGNLSEKEATS